MIIGDRLRVLREEKKLSQGDIEKRTGLLRCYISRVANLPKRKSSDDIAWGSVGKDARFLNKLRRLLSKVEDGDRKLILYMAQKMANR